MQIQSIQNQTNFNGGFLKSTKIKVKTDGANVEDQAILELYKHYKTTKNFRGATIDAYKKNRAIVTIYSGSSSNEKIKEHKNIFSKLANKIFNTIKVEK
jgi:hypothetical protein